MKYYAIRRKSDGFLFPERRRAYSVSEPEDPAVAPPRLFAKIGPAKNALSAWLKGVHHVEWEGDPVEADYNPVIVSNPVDGRNREDYEIVEIFLSFSPPEAVPNFSLGSNYSPFGSDMFTGYSAKVDFDIAWPENRAHPNGKNF